MPGLPSYKIPEASGTLDFLGVNFYRRQFIRCGLWTGQWFGQPCGLSHHAREVKEITTWMGWEVHPDSFVQTLMRASTLHLPILITENGTSMADDARRWQFIAQHLQAMRRAMDHGADVIGYCYWSLLDNFEWAHGFAPRFGLIEVDYATQQRRMRDSALRYADVCRTNRLELESDR